MSWWSLGAIQDQHHVLSRLVDHQLGRRAAQVKARLFAEAAATLQSSGVSANEPAVACFVPGRIEVLGKHTDYAGGRSLVATIERGICLVAVRSVGQQIRVTDARVEQSAEFMLHPQLHPRRGHWSNYPMTVARRVARNFSGSLCGAQIAFVSDLSPAAGMSSSSALVVATFLALSALNELPQCEVYRQNIHGREELAGYLATVENGQSYGSLIGDHGVGTFGGSEDHTAILCARAGQLSQYSYCPVRFERSIALPEDFCFVVAVSGVVAEKTRAAMAKYNRISQLATAVVDIWRSATGRSDPHLAAALASSPDAAERIRQSLHHAGHPQFEDSELLERFEQFLAESEQLIPSVEDSLVGPALLRFGQWVEQSQSLGARLLKNQVPETVFLADLARKLGAAAASAFGAGFGGSVWALVKTDEVAGFSPAWSAGYTKAYPQHSHRATFETTGAGPAAFLFAPSIIVGSSRGRDNDRTRPPRPGRGDRGLL